MIEWTFTVEDVARIRFGFSPLVELVMSLIVLRAPESHSLHLPWVRATRPLAVKLDLSELFALVPVHGPTADFLTRRPDSRCRTSPGRSKDSGLPRRTGWPRTWP
ncbi:MAG: hypothetical protein ACRDN0_10635, partial [Trebonia sp.]